MTSIENPKSINELGLPSTAWKELLSKPVEDLSAKALNWWKGGLIFANISISRMPELVIQVNSLVLDGAARKQASASVAGLEIWYENLNFNGSTVPSMVLRPKYSENSDVFYALADHMVESTAQRDDIESGSEILEAIIASWVKFWMKEKSESNRELILGLIGELIAIEQVLDLSEANFEIWEGPKGSPQDFRGLRDSLEVKVQGTHTGPIIHKISSVLQMQIPENGKLYVLSLRVKLGANGARSVDDLVSSVSNLPIFQEPKAQDFLMGALDKASYSKNLPVNLSRFDVVEQGLYEVTDEFPRLTKQNIPNDARVFDLSYSIDFSGAKDFLMPETTEKLILR